MMPTLAIMAMAVASAATTTEVRESEPCQAARRPAGFPHASAAPAARWRGSPPAPRPGRPARPRPQPAERPHSRPPDSHSTRRRARAAQAASRKARRPCQSAPPAQARAMLVRAAAHGLGRRHLHGLARRRQRRNQRHHRAGQRFPASASPRGQLHRRRPAGGVERVHRSGDQPHHAPASSRPAPPPALRPPMPSSSASARNSHSTVHRAAPSARRMPISARRRTTLTAMVL